MDTQTTPRDPTGQPDAPTQNGAFSAEATGTVRNADAVSLAQLEANALTALEENIATAMEALSMLRAAKMAQLQMGGLEMTHRAHSFLTSFRNLLPYITQEPEAGTPARKRLALACVRLEKVDVERSQLIAATETAYLSASAEYIAAGREHAKEAIGMCHECQAALYDGDSGYYAAGLFLCAAHAPTYGEQAEALKEELDADPHFKPDWAEDRAAAYAQADKWEATGDTRMLTLL